MLRHCLVLAAGLCCAGPVAAATWADAMFEGLSKDFGSVPRGSQLTHLFRLTNKSDQPVHIASMRVSCGCVTAQALVSELAPGQSTVITAVMDTNRFAGVRSVTIYVNFSRPSAEEVRLWVQANSRDDVSMSPESLAYGQIKRGVSPSATVTINMLGDQGFRIEGAQCETNYVQTALKEVRREGGQVSYQLTTTLRADTPVGKWYSDVWLKTNNPTMPRIRVPLTVEIESSLRLSPASVTLGDVKVGGHGDRKVILSGVKAFQVTGFLGTDDVLQVRDVTGASKEIHVLEVTLRPTAVGDVIRRIRVQTDLPEEGEIEFQATARAVP